MTQVFVSYKSEDRARIAPLVAALEADGVGVWWDAHIGGGSSWRQTIEDELSAARCVVVVWSERSVGREGSFVADEATRAQRRGAYLPVRIDPVEPPLGFGETQAISLIGWKGDRTDPHYQGLLAAVQAVLAGKPRPTPPAYQAKRVIDRRLVLGGGVAAVAVAGAGGWWVTHHAAAPGDSVAVLPFDNLSGDPAQAYFSDGIAEELRDALTRIASLKVAARSSSELMRDADAKTAALKLGVASILTGSVRRGAGSIRINAELVDGISGLTRWSQAYDRAVGDTLAIQSDIADSVAGALKVALGGAQKALLVQGATSNPEAQEAYLRGLALARKNKVADALPQFEAAIAADPNYAKAYFSLGGNAAAALSSGTATGQALRAQLDTAERSIRRGLALAPGSGKGFSALGVVFQTRLDLRKAQDAYDTGYRMLPGDATVLRTKAVFDSYMGNVDSVALYKRAIALDPLRPANARLFAQTLYLLGRFDEAIVVAHEALKAIPDDPSVQVILALIALLKNRPDEAIRTAALIPAHDDNRPFADVAAIAAVKDAAGDRELANFEARYPNSHYYEIAEIHAWRRRPDLAFAAIARAWDRLEPGLIQFKTDPLLAPIRSDPRYGEWLRKIGFP